MNKTVALIGRGGGGRGRQEGKSALRACAHGLDVPRLILGPPRTELLAFRTRQTSVAPRPLSSHQPCRHLSRYALHCAQACACWRYAFLAAARASRARALRNRSVRPASRARRARALRDRSVRPGPASRASRARARWNRSMLYCAYACNRARAARVCACIASCAWIYLTQITHSHVAARALPRLRRHRCMLAY